MKTVEVNNDTIGEFKHSESYFVLVFSILYFVVVIIVYPLWIIAMTVNIKKRVRKLRQLRANILVSREEEERQKWNLYNEETYLVKESYLLAICICEFSLVILALSVQMYVLLKRDLEEFHNTAVPPEYKCITNSVRIVLYEEPIVMLLEGSILIFLHTVILLVCSLIRYLIDRYLLRKTYNRLTIIVYGILSCVFIMIFFNKYTYYFRIFPSFVFVVDLFLLLRYRKKLSLVLIGRVREIQQCYGNNCRRYQYEYRNWISFRKLTFLFCLGMLIFYLSYLTNLVMHLFTRHIYPCNGDPFLEIALPILYEFTYFFNLVGQIIIFGPCFVYTFYLIIRDCVTRFKKQPNFHDEKIKPLIDRYHKNIMN